MQPRPSREDRVEPRRALDRDVKILEAPAQQVHAVVQRRREGMEVAQHVAPRPPGAPSARPRKAREARRARGAKARK